MNVRRKLHNLKSDFNGFVELISVYKQSQGLFFGGIEIDMSEVSWLEANMCSPFGAILYKISRHLNKVKLTEIRPAVEKILSKNSFLANYGRIQKFDTYGTTIEYKRFEPKDGRYFGEYIESKLVGKGIPKMSPGLTKKFRESIFEIFSNSVIHSETTMGIFSCGQYFPRLKRLDFAICDLGIGIRENIRKNCGFDLGPEKAIAWAMEGKNTTKKDNIPGGLGLKLLREFITMNKGRILIVSDRGYWELTKTGKIVEAVLPDRFPGTVVNIEINTSDAKSYCLKSEIDPKDIF